MSVSNVASLSPLPPKADPTLPWAERIRALALEIFRYLADFASIFTRYLGSKDWSVPGVILRAPTLLFHRLMGRPSTLSSGYERGFQELGKKEAERFLPHAFATAFVTSFKSDYLHRDFEEVDPRNLGPLPNLPPEVQRHERGFFHPPTRLRVALLRSRKEREKYILAFSSLKPNSKEVPAAEQIQRKASQVFAWAGGVPQVFEVASQLVNSLKQSGIFQDQQLELTGMCFGAALCSYAALQNGVPAVCFNSCPLGVGLQQKIGSEKLKKASQYITHISSRHDFISDPFALSSLDLIVSRLGLRTPGNFGKRFRISRVPHYDSFQNHAYILGNLLHHCGLNERTKGNQIL